MTFIMNVLDDLYLYVSAIIASGGYIDSMMYEKSVEVLHSDGTPWCSLPDLPDDRSYHTQTGLLTCDGVSTSTKKTGTSCIKFSEGKWKPSHKLKEERYTHSSWASPLGTVLMGGEEGEPVEDIGKTTELLDETSGKSVMHFPLKYGEV